MINVVVNRTVRPQSCPIAKVVCPAPQHPIEPPYHFLPWVLIARAKQCCYALLRPLNRFLRRLRSQIPVAIFPIPLWPKTVAQKIEPLLSCITNTSLAFVERKLNCTHHTTRPLKRLNRVLAAQDHQVVSVIDDVCPILLSLSLLMPSSQEPMHVDVGQQRTDDSPLRRPHLAPLASRHASISPLVTLLHRYFQPSPDELQHLLVHDSLFYLLHQLMVRNRIKVLRQISVDYIGVSLAQQPVHFSNCILSPAFRSIAVGTGLKVRFKNRLQHQLGGSLHHSVPNNRYPQGPLPASWLGNHHPAHCAWLVRLVVQLLSYCEKPLLQPFGLDALKRDTVHTRCSAVISGKRIGLCYDVSPIHLVIKLVKATLGILLRRNIKLSLKLADRFGSPQAHANPPPSGSFKSTQKQGPFPPPALTGFLSTMGLSDSSKSRCLMQRREPLPLAHRGLPRFANNLSPVPFPLPRRTVKRALVDCLLSTQRPSPKFRRVGVRIFTFEACSGFTRVTARG